MVDREELLTYLNGNLADKAVYYSQEQLPAQIGTALYTFGSNEDFDILAFIDASEKLDGTSGMLFTPTHLYFKFSKSGIIDYQDIEALSLEKHRHQVSTKATIKLKQTTYRFSNDYICQEELIHLLSKITNISVEKIRTLHEKAEDNIRMVLSDIENDIYEDVYLDDTQKQQIKEYYEELAVIDNLDDENYEIEMEALCKSALDFFDLLELDSEEIDILLDIQQQFDKKQEIEEQKLDEAKNFYDDMMNKYQQGDPSLFDKVKGMMSSLGIDEEELKNKSPQELEQYLTDLCHRFGISKSMLEKMAKKFSS